VGTKKTVWSNFNEICKTLNRSPDHVFQFMMAELGTEGSIDGSERLVIKGKFVPKVRHLSWKAIYALTAVFL
jgi:translation initiation factor 2 subunit 2